MTQTSAPTSSQSAPRPLSAEAMWRLARIGAPALSPDGARVVYPVTTYDLDANRGRTHLVLRDLAGGPARRLTMGPADSDPRWSPDGRWIVFVGKREGDGEAQLYLLPVDGGEARRLTEMPMGALGPKWFADSRRIAFIARVWPDLDTLADQRRRLAERGASRTSARIWDRGPVTQWDRFTDDREAHLFVTDIDGAPPRALTQPTGRALVLNEPDAGSGVYDIAPDGAVAFVSNTDKTGRRHKHELFEIGPQGGAARLLTPDTSADQGAPRYSPDGRHLAFSQQRIPGFYADTARLMLLDRSSGAIRGLTEDFDRSVPDARWLPDGSGLIAVVGDSAVQRVHQFDLEGGRPRALTGGADHGALDLAPGVIVSLRRTLDEPPHLVAIDPRDGTERRLTDENDQALAGVAMGRVDSVTIPGDGGAPIQMWVVYPPDFDPARRYPVFLLLHGGPHNAITNEWTWRWNAQVFAGWGYVVAWHNFHGSSTFGQTFADCINPDRATKPHADTLAAAQWLATRPYVDPERMVAGGGSFGGYLACLLLGGDHPFKALIAHAAVYNEFTQIASDYGAETSRFPEFWEDPTIFQTISPHLRAGRFTTPTLVIHGQLDQRVPVNHGFELFNTLQRRAVTSRLVYFPDENHWVLKPGNSLLWYEEVRAWLARWIGAGP